MREHTVTYNGKQITDYEASQIQRGFERKIRQSRNLLTALDEQGKVTPSTEQKNAFAAESVRLKAREGKLRDFCKQTGRRSDSLRTKTASWNRSTSQKAVWANKKAVAKIYDSGIIRTELEKGSIKLEINPEKQNRHIKGTDEYIEGKSYLTISIEEASEIVKRKHGTGMLRFSKTGEWKRKEVVECEEVIGIDVDVKTGQETLTKGATIHYSKTGTHIVPWRKKQ